MGQERVWQKLSKGTGGFQINGTFSDVEHDIFSILEIISGRHFTIHDIVGTRIVKKFEGEKNLYGGSMQLECFRCHPKPSPYEKVHFHLWHNVLEEMRRGFCQSELLSTAVTISYETWESYSPLKGLSVYVRRFLQTHPSSGFQEIPLLGRDPFSLDLWMGKPPPFSRSKQWLREVAKAKFVLQ